MPKQFPLLEFSGSHFDFGQAMGEMYCNEIHKVIKSNKSQASNYSDLYELTKQYYDVSYKYIPEIVDEIKGMADAIGADLIDCFLINTREVSDLIHDPLEKDLAKEAEHCTIAVSFHNQQAIIGHNEDMDESYQDDLYLIKATVAGNSFIALNYRAVVPGLACGMNSAGLVQCINELHPINCGIGIPKMLLARKVLGFKTLTDAEKFLYNVPRASGFNHVLIQGNEIKNVEIAGDQIATQYVINEPYVHTNHYLSKELKDFEKVHTQSSIARYRRASELVKNDMSIEDMGVLLSDEKDPKYPIRRVHETIGSCVFDLSARDCYVSFGLPSRDNFIKYSI